MSVEQITRAWKDEDFRHSLGAAGRARLPDYRAGLIDLTAAALQALTGGYLASIGCPQQETACSVSDWF